MNTVTQKTRIERILEPFGATHGSELIAFFNKISTHECDAIIFMARKALCLYRLFVLCGIKRPRATVYSDSIVRGQDFTDKKVLIIDDTLFVGTTLSETKSKMDKTNAYLAEYWVYGVDTETWNEKTFKPDYIHCQMNAQEMIEFCAAECRALINAGIPYLTDFSASKRIILKSKELDIAIKPHNWFFYDVSTQFHENNKIKYYSALPDHFVEETIKKQIGDSLYGLIEIAKIRVFASWTGKYYEVTFVPVVTFGSASIAKIKKASKALLDIVGMDTALVDNNNVEELVRLMQFLVGALYLKTYFGHLEQIKSVSLSEKFDYSWCSSVFHEKLSDKVASTISSIYTKEISRSPVQLPMFRGNEPTKEVNETKINIDKFLSDYFGSPCNEDFQDTPLSDLTAIFLEFHSKYENLARQEIKHDIEKPNYRDRLKKGMAWGALSNYLLSKYKIKNSRFKRNLLSIVLDRLVDFGIAVPIIAFSGGSVYRAYRHGEDVRFGAQEENLVFNIIHGFQAGRGTLGVEGIYFEKLMVILLRVGMNEEWLNLWYSRTGKDTLVRVGYSLQGAVAISPNRDDEYLPEHESSWLSRRLCKSGVICEPLKGESLYKLGTEPEAAHAKRESKRTAISLGLAIGKACVSSGKERTNERPLATKDLIIITSCSNLMDVSGATAAELDLFDRWYKNQGRQLLIGWGKQSQFKGRIRVPTIISSRGAQAVNSGAWKIRKYKENAIELIKEKVYRLAETDIEWINKEHFWDAVFEAFDKKVNEKDNTRLLKHLNSIESMLNTCLWILDLLELIFKDRQKDRQSTKAKKLTDKLIERNTTKKFHDDNDEYLYQKILEKNDLERNLSRRENEILSKSFDALILSHCQLISQEAQLVLSTLNKTDKKLFRKTYRFVVWYDILDVRVRKKSTPDEIASYSFGVDEFRNKTNYMLENNAERIRLKGGEMFCDTGEIRSMNDEKHIFICDSKSPEEEGFIIANDIMRIAAETNVKIRLMMSPTNLRGEYVFLNRGETSIDGDFKSHFHTIIQEVHGHHLEGSLVLGQSILWCVDNMVRQFTPNGSLSVVAKGEPEHIKVNIKGVNTENVVAPLICEVS